MSSKQSTTGVLEPGSAAAWRVDDPLNLQTTRARQSTTLRGPTVAVVQFLLHFLEMVIAMGIGMTVFGPVKIALVDQGYTTLLDRTSLD